MMNNKIAIAGIHTDIGKTITSAVIAEALGADYWKPVQAGNLDESDSIRVRSLISNANKRVHEEAVKLTQPMSPHAAAAIDALEVDHTKFTLPVTDKTLLVETAGGLLSPVSDDATVADMIQYFKLPAILVSKNYLGSINHTLLSVEVLRARKIPIIGIVMNGDENKESEQFIESYTSVPIIARIPQMQLTPQAIAASAAAIKDTLLQHINNGKHY